jgi:hypothetical protein
VCRLSIEADDLVRVLPDWTAGGGFITLLTPHRRGQLPSVRALSYYVVEQLRLSMALDA